MADKEDGALIFPVRTHYLGDVVEIIAPKFLREQLNVKDGDSIKVRAFTSTLQKASASPK
jgi:CTP-dependent riboflavin kinase